jgi:hypothetical protein
MSKNPIKIEAGRYNSCNHFGSRKAGFAVPIQNRINVANIASSQRLHLTAGESFI